MNAIENVLYVEHVNLIKKQNTNNNLQQSLLMSSTGLPSMSAANESSSFDEIFAVMMQEPISSIPLAVTLMSLVVANFILNLLFIITIVVSKKISIATKVLLINLSLITFFFALPASFFGTLIEIYNGRWFFDQVICQIYHFLCTAFPGALLTMLAFIAMDERAVVHGRLPYRLSGEAAWSSCRKSVAVYGITGINFLACGFSWRKVTVENNTCNLADNPSFIFLQLVFFFIVPVVLIAAFISSFIAKRPAEVDSLKEKYRLAMLSAEETASGLQMKMHDSDTVSVTGAHYQRRISQCSNVLRTTDDDQLNAEERAKKRKSTN